MSSLVFIIGGVGVVLALAGLSISLGLRAVMFALLAIQEALAEIARDHG